MLLHHGADDLSLDVFRDLVFRLALRTGGKLAHRDADILDGVQAVSDHAGQDLDHKSLATFQSLA